MYKRQAKGGVGKSSITASIALSLSKHKKIGILDADVYGPNQNILFNLDTKNEIVDKQIIPITKKGIKIISMGNIMNYEDAAVWRGPMLSGAIKKLVHDTKWGELDYLLIDMPPGTGDVYLTIFNELSIDKFILITTPNILAISDLQKTITMLKKLNIKILWKGKGLNEIGYDILNKKKIILVDKNYIRPLDVNTLLGLSLIHI